jgi:1-acyl-sn-glycerol-3-phosphate acyltransferase
MSRVESHLAGNGRISLVVYRIFHVVVTGVIRIYTRMSIEGREHVPREGAFVLAPVHRSYVDTPIAACVTRRRMRFMGKDAVWKYRSVGWLASALGAFPVTRGSADREAFKRAVTVVSAGEPLVLFPEGERKSGPVVQPLFDGAVYIASKAGVPIVPVGIGGSERVMPKKAKFLYPRKVHVIVGPPIMPPETVNGRLPRGAVKEQSERLHAELQRLFDEAQRRVDRTPPSA